MIGLAFEQTPVHCLLNVVCFILVYFVCLRPVASSWSEAQWPTTGPSQALTYFPDFLVGFIWPLRLYWRPPTLGSSSLYWVESFRYVGGKGLVWFQNTQPCHLSMPPLKNGHKQSPDWSIWHHLPRVKRWLLRRFVNACRSWHVADTWQLLIGQSTWIGMIGRSEGLLLDEKVVITFRPLGNEAFILASMWSLRCVNIYSEGKH
jgi:hypothetical protein